MGSMLVNLIWWLDMIKADFVALSNSLPTDTYMACYAQNWTACNNWGRICEYHDFCSYWRNPLKRIDTIPMGMEIRFWDPTEEPVRVEVNL
jgi:hypothetical protein